MAEVQIQICVNFLSENAAKNEEEEKGRMVIHAIDREMVLGWAFWME